MREYRENFVKEFGEEEAIKIEEAALEHNNEIHPCGEEIDSFIWSIAICIGYQCFEIERYRQYHKINAPYIKIKEWIIKNNLFKNYQGHLDYVSLLVGAYNDYIPKETPDE